MQSIKGQSTIGHQIIHHHPIIYTSLSVKLKHYTISHFLSMDSKSVSFCIILLIATLLCGVVRSDTAKDRAECADQLVGLAPCLPYVSGDAKLPTPDCCTGLKEVVEKSKKCLCILVKDRDDPSLGFKINATLALGLPDKCHAPANISQCPGKSLTRIGSLVCV